MFDCLFVFQFEPESFVEGLLGIGAAGGGSSGKSEGAILAARLTVMRKERDARAKVVKQAAKVQALEPVTANTPPPPPQTTSQKPSRPKNKKKKKKGKK